MAGCGAPASLVAGQDQAARRATNRPAGPANRGLSSGVSQCLPLQDPAAGVTAYASDGTRLPFTVRAGHEPGTEPRCRPNELRVLRLAVLPIAGALSYVRRGGCQIPCVVRQATVHLHASAFSARVSLLPAAARHGDGAPRPGCRTSVRNAPQRAGRELKRMFYKRPSPTDARRPISPDVGARWSNYGDPGARYRRAGTGPTDYNYLLWNLPRTPTGVLHGGGIVEALITRGEPLELCPAGHLRLASFDRNGRPNGAVEFAYAAIAPGSAAAIYGWVLVAYTYQGRRHGLTTGPLDRRRPSVITSA